MFMKYFFRLVMLLIVLNSVPVSADSYGNFNPKNYVYDDEGSPVFVRVYVNDSTTESSNRNRKAASLFLKEEGAQILDLMLQEDQKGSFLAIPLKKKKQKDDNEDESTWECPMCGRENPAYRNTCQFSDCPLNRKGIRERDCFYLD
jgi:hypothetical protein